MGLFNNIFGTPRPAPAIKNTAGKRAGTASGSGKETITLTKGEVVRGEVTDLRSNEVTVRLEDGRTLHAKLDTAAELAIGQESEFLVQDSDETLITLKILSDGDTSFAESAIDKALEASGFPKSQNAVSIVRSLLTAGLPANKEIIQKMMQYAAANKGVAHSTLAALLKNNIPVTKVNASQLQAYRNFEHRLLSQASTLTSSLASALRFGEASPEFATRLLSAFFAGEGDAISEAGAPASGIPSENGTPAGNGELSENSVSSDQGFAVTSGTSSEAAFPLNFAVESAPASGTPQEPVSTMSAKNAADAQTQAASSTADAQTQATLTAADARTQAASSSTDAQMQAALSATDAQTQATSPATDAQMQTTPTAAPQTQAASLSDARQPLSQLLPKEEAEPLFRIIQELSAANPDEPQLAALADNPAAASPANLFAALAVHGKEKPSSLAALLKKEPVLTDLLDKTLLSGFVMKPEDLTQEDSVKKFYEELNRTLAKMADLTKNSEDSPALKTAADTAGKMQDNLSFMNALNQVFPYVQLPLQMTEQLTHGELYVYTKKKDLSSENKEVSILLHLDMDFLGPTDVHVSLFRQAVNAHFYLPDEAAGTLVSEHLSELSDALAKKGFTLTAAVTKREKEPDIVNDFMGAGETASIKRFRFDIRA